MATVKGPLFSLGASGTIGGAIVFSTWKGRDYVRRHAVPANPRSKGQLGVRAMMEFLSQEWDGLSDVQKADWDTRAAVTNVSAFNAYIGYNMTRWGMNTYPSKLDPADPDANDSGGASGWSYTAGVRCVTIEFTLDTAANNWGALIYRDVAAEPGPERSDLVHVVPCETADDYTWVDTPLTPGTIKYYGGALVSGLGCMPGMVSYGSATPLP